MSNTLDLDLSVSYGWCSMHLASTDAEQKIRTHWLVDGLTELAIAVEALLAGRPSVSVRWPLELAGGHFIDFVMSPNEQLQIAISELEYPVGTDDINEVWSAVRGTLVFRASVPLNTFVRKYLSAMRILRVRNVDVGGQVIEWRHSFPQTIYETVEQAATARFGYKPLTVEEINAS